MKVIMFVIGILLLCGCLQAVVDTPVLDKCFDKCFDNTYSNKTAYNVCRDKCIGTMNYTD